MKTTRTLLAVLSLLVLPTETLAQQDTSSFFPLGLWGLWLPHDTLVSPYPPRSLSVDQWTREKGNLDNIKATYLVAWYPYSMFDMMIDYAEGAGYKMDTHMGSWQSGLYEYGLPDTYYQFRTWGSCDTSLTQEWRDTVDARINHVLTQWGGSPAFHSYFIGHELDFWYDRDYDGRPIGDTCHWKAIGYILTRIKQLDLDPRHKTYAIHWGKRAGPPPDYQFPRGLDLPFYARRFPHLDIYQVDDYVFTNWRQKSYTYQQNGLDSLLISYNDCMNAFRESTTEWHAVIQSQREWVNRFPNHGFRRPTLEELKVQAWLALSRGAKGVTAFVYGSSLPPPALGEVAFPPPNLPQGFQTGRSKIAVNDTIYFDGLVKTEASGTSFQRNPFTIQNDYEQIAAFANMTSLNEELHPLRTAIRKLRVYDAFPRTAIPANNIAHISGVSGDKIELGVFKRIDRGTDSTVYFMLVNRVCNDSQGNLSQPQQVTATFDASESRLITEVVSGQAWVVAPGNGSFTVILDPGSGKLFSVESATIASRSFPRGVWIGPGATLEVGSGATVTVGEDQAIVVDGTLLVKGTAQQPVTLTSTTGKWTGIADGLAAPSVSLDYAGISNAYTGVNVGNWSTLTIDHASFTGCDIGVNIYPCPCDQTGPIRVSNTSFTAPHMSALAVILSNHSNGLLTNNAFYGGVHKGAGVYLDASSPQMLGSAVEFFKYGLACTNGSSPLLEEQDDGGFNLLRNNKTAVHCEQGSDAVLGEAQDGGQNIVCMNTTDVAVYESSVSATNNSWRSLEDPPGVFEVYDGELDYAHWLPPDPNCGGASAPVAVGKSVLEPAPMGGLPPVIRTILERRRRGLYDDALRLIRAVLTDESATEETKRWALGQLLAVGQRTRGGDLSGFLTRLRQSEASLARRISGLLPAVHLHEGSSAAAMAAYEANIRDYPGSSLARGGWYGKFTHALYLRRDTAQARRVLERLQEGFAGSVQAEIAELQLNSVRRISMPGSSAGNPAGVGKGTPGTTPAPGIPAEFALSQNYPNPFNPSTEIRYELPEQARVSLTIYDMLGRVVETLLDETKGAGYHAVRWNAAGRSSGVYLARFTATTEAGRTALQETMKLVLTK